MDELNKFENSLREKLEAQEFPFDEQNWEKARALIDESRKRKKRFFLLYLFAGIIGAAGIWMLVTQNRNSSETLMAVKKEQPQEDAKQQTRPGEEAETVKAPENHTAKGQNTSKQFTDAYSSNENASKTASGSPAPTENKTLQTTDNKPNNKNSEKVKTETGASSENEKSVPAVSPANKKNTTSLMNGAPGTTSAKKETHKSAGSVASLENNRDEIASKTSNTEAPTTSKVKKEEAIVLSGGNASPSSTSKQKNNSPAESSGKKNTAPAEMPLVSANHNSNDENKQLNGKKNDNASVDNSNAQTATSATIKTGSKDSVRVKETILAAASSTLSDSSAIKPVVKDSIAAENKNDALPTKGDDDKPADYPKNILFIEAGVSLYQGWTELGPAKDGRGLSPAAGIQYMRRISPKLAIGLGAQYTPIDHLTCSAYSSVSTYDFGKEQDITLVYYKTLFYVSAPIRIYYIHNEANIFGAGLTSSYLLTTKSEVVQESFSDISSSPNVTSSSKEKGYMTGFRSTDFQASLFYRRRIYRDFSVKAEILIGLVDVKDNTRFIDPSGLILLNQEKDKTHGFRLTLCYDIFKK